MDNHQRPAHDENGNIIKTNDSFLDDPAPDVEFKDKTFVLTGVFTIADRSEVARMILERGGKTSKAVTRSTDYVVTAEVASSAYVNGNYGTKIKEAIARGMETSTAASTIGQKASITSLARAASINGRLIKSCSNTKISFLNFLPIVSKK